MKMKVAELIVAAVTPLIRRQAFIEAADIIENDPTTGSMAGLNYALGYEDAKGLAAALVRGLGEE